MAHYIEDKRNATFFVMGSLETPLPMDSIARTIHAALKDLDSFRKTHLVEITALCAQVLVALGQNNLLPGVNAGEDGTIIRAVSSRHSSKKRGSLERQIARVETLLRERLSEEQDAAAQDDVVELVNRISKLKETLKQMDEMKLKDRDDRITTTEPEAKLLKQKDGSLSHAGIPGGGV